MSKSSKADVFLAALSPEALSGNSLTAQGNKPEDVPKTQRKQAGRKHIGGYFDRDMVEKVAILRARLALDNSGLIKLAIEDLYRKHEAKRAFGDV